MEDTRWNVGRPELWQTLRRLDLQVNGSAVSIMALQTAAVRRCLCCPQAPQTSYLTQLRQYKINATLNKVPPPPNWNSLRRSGMRLATLAKFDNGLAGDSIAPAAARASTQQPFASDGKQRHAGWNIWITGDSGLGTSNVHR